MSSLIPAYIACSVWNPQRSGSVDAPYSTYYLPVYVQIPASTPIPSNITTVLSSRSYTSSNNSNWECDNFDTVANTQANLGKNRICLPQPAPAQTGTQWQNLPSNGVSSTLPVSALPFTLRSSSLQQQQAVDHQNMPPSATVSSGGLPSSRWAPADTYSINSVSNASQENMEPQWASAPAFQPRNAFQNNITTQSTSVPEANRPSNDFMAQARSLMGRPGPTLNPQQTPTKTGSKAIPIKQAVPKNPVKDESHSPQTSSPLVKGQTSPQKKVVSSITGQKEFSTSKTDPVVAPNHSPFYQLNLDSYLKGKVLVKKETFQSAMTLNSNVQATAAKQNDTIKLLDGHLSDASKLILEVEQSVDALAEFLTTFREKIDVAKTKIVTGYSELASASKLVIELPFSKSLEDELSASIRDGLNPINGEEVATQVQTDVQAHINIITDGIKKQATEEAIAVEAAKAEDIKQTEIKQEINQETATVNGVQGGNSEGVVNNLPTPKLNGQIVNGTAQAAKAADAEEEEKRKKISQSRKVRLTDLPAGCTLKEISRLVWGGKLLSLNFSPGTTFCSVLFLTIEGCDKYYAETETGIPWPEDPSHQIQVLRSTKADPPTDYQLSLVDNNVTRVIRFVGLPKSMDSAFNDFITKQNFTVENMIVGRDGASNKRAYEIRFASIENAVAFTAMMQEHEEYKEYECRYARDPCAAATGVHK